MVRQCRDCSEMFEVSSKQINFQRLIQNRRGYVLCPSCSQKKVDAKWATRIAAIAKVEKSKPNQIARQRAATARVVRSIVAKM